MRISDWSSDGALPICFPASWETPDSFTATTTDYAKGGYSNRSEKCTRRVNQDKIKYPRDDANGTVFHTWIYDRISFDIRGLKAGGSNWNNSINLRVGSGGSEETVDWDGCIEERKTVSRSSYDPIPTEAMDLNIDLVPDRTDQDTLWGPALPDIIFARPRPYRWNQMNGPHKIKN